MSSAKCCSFRLGLNVLNVFGVSIVNHWSHRVNYLTPRQVRDGRDERSDIMATLVGTSALPLIISSGTGLTVTFGSNGITTTGPNGTIPDGARMGYKKGQQYTPNSEINAKFAVTGAVWGCRDDNLSSACDDKIMSTLGFSDRIVPHPGHDSVAEIWQGYYYCDV